jgi:hypothetical protein
MLWIPQSIDSRLRDGGKVVSLTHWPRSTPHEHYFCYRLSEPQGVVWLEGSGTLKKLICLIASRTRDLPACSMVPQQLRYRVPLIYLCIFINFCRILFFSSLFRMQSI